MSALPNMDATAFLGALVLALLALVPIFTLAYLAVMGQVRMVIRKEFDDVNVKTDSVVKDLIALEKRMTEEIAGIRRHQELTCLELQHIRKGVERLEAMVAELILARGNVQGRNNGNLGSLVGGF